jgi:DNA modification methylase
MDMPASTRVRKATESAESEVFNPSDWLPPEIGRITNHQTDLPRIAKDPKAIAAIESRLSQIPTSHDLYNRDSRRIDFLAPNSVHLVVTSPPYWTLKDYRDHPDQMGDIADYEEFIGELDRVWQACYDALVPGGRMVCVVGDVCLSRRKNEGEHTVVPLHASIQEHCRRIGFSNLAPIIWYKIANAAYEADGNGGGFLGKPYEPNAVIKNDIEFILMERKPGGYRSPSVATRILSVIPAERHKVWFQQIWTGVTGASTREHPAPYPIELAERLVRMFSFVGDTVLDPFLGTGTTSVAAARWGRNSIGVEVDPHYFEMAASRLSNDRGLFSATSVRLMRGENGQVRGDRSDGRTASDSALLAYENEANKRATGRAGSRPRTTGRSHRRKAA